MPLGPLWSGVQRLAIRLHSLRLRGHRHSSYPSSVRFLSTAWHDLLPATLPDTVERRGASARIRRVLLQTAAVTGTLLRLDRPPHQKRAYGLFGERECPTNSTARDRDLWAPRKIYVFGLRGSILR